MILEAFACSVFSLTEFSKTQHFSLEEDTKEKILSDGLYHFTSKEIADKIVKDGYFRPTKGRIRNHLGKDKVYMFAGIPDIASFSKNLPANLNPFVSGNLEFSAVKVQPSSQELSNFKERLQDSAVVYEGRYDIASSRGKSIELVLDLVEEGKCVFREKTQEEIENGYVPSQELLNYIEKHKVGKMMSAFQLLYHEVKSGLTSIPKGIPRFYRDFKDKRDKKRAIKEFEPYSFELRTLDENGENTYSVNCDKLEFFGDKKLSRVKIDKIIDATGEVSSYEYYVDGHILNLGEEAAAIYLKRVEDAIGSKMLNKVNGIHYAGQPMLDVENEQVTIGVDESFNELLKERNMAEFLGETRMKSEDIFQKKVKEYYKKHPLKSIMHKLDIKRGKIPLLEDKKQISKYTNGKLIDFSIEDVHKGAISEQEAFQLSKKCEFKYKGGSKYSALIGESVELGGKRLTKLIVGEDSNYLSEHADDTVELPRNYYIENTDFDKIDKKDLADFLSNLQYDNNEQDEVRIEQNGFVGKYIGGVKLDKKGRIVGRTYDDSLSKKYGHEVHITEDSKHFDLSGFVCDESSITSNYVSGIEKAKINREEEIDRESL